LKKILVISILAVILLSSSTSTNADTGKKEIADSSAKEIKNSDKISIESSSEDQIKAHLGLQPNEKRVIVIYKDDVKKADKDKLEQKGGKIKLDLKNLNGVAVQVDQNKIKEIESDPNVAQVIDDTIMHASLSVSVPQIGANLVQSLGITGKNVKVCVVDTGIDDTHPALSPLVAEIDYASTPDDNDATDDNGHGTHVAGIIASRDALYKGIAPNASLMAAKVLDSTGSGWSSDVINGINWCVSNGADVINLSLGGSIGYTGACDSNLDAQAVNNAVNQGVIVAVASGNNGFIDRVTSPSCASKAITVGAIDQNDGRTPFSNEGTELDVVAPGVSVTSLKAPLNGGGFVAFSGTSMATPHVVGLAALLLEKNPNLSPQQVRDIIQNTALDLVTPSPAVNGFDTVYGYGRIHANDAISATTPASVLIPSATGAGNVQFSTNNGGITSFFAIAESTLPTIGKPTISFPFGFFTYTVTGITPGSSAAITITYPSNVPIGTQFWKVNAGTWTNISSLVSSNNGDQIIILTIQDGQFGDADGTINGQIIDPVGGGSGGLFCGKTINQFTSVINGTESNNVVVGTAGDDLINGLGGDDRIFGREGDDCIFGGIGNDYLVGGAGNDEIDGEDGNDKIWGQSGMDILYGSFGSDRIAGGADNDSIFGEDDNDFLWGQIGDDTLDGGNQIDMCSGGIGANTFTMCE
jgi:subtilisin family serine protease